MKRTLVAREVANALHATEASLEATLANSRAALERLILAKAEMGLTGTMGDAAIARMRDSVRALEDAQDLMFESHREAYTVLKTVDPSTRMQITKLSASERVGDDVRVA